MVVDYTRESCKSWQLIRFPPRPVVFIRIVGTHNSANEVFHCVHFECPSCEKQGTSAATKDSTSKSLTSDKDAAMQTTEMATEADELHSDDEDKV